MINFMLMGKFPTHSIWQLVKAVPAAMFLTNAFSSVAGGGGWTAPGICTHYLTWRQGWDGLTLLRLSKVPQ